MIRNNYLCSRGQSPYEFQLELDPMVKSVLKRDGRRVDFNNQKIVAAILKAMDVTDAGEDIVLAAQIAQRISELDRDEMTVEEIQEILEEVKKNAGK